MLRTERLDAEPEPVTAPHRRVFESILFATSDGDAAAAQPPYFADLNLDQVVDAIVAGRDEYELRVFFHGPFLRDVDGVDYRHEVFCELEAEPVRTAVRKFAEGMRTMRRYVELARKQHYRYEKERWFLDAATAYRDAATNLRDALAALELHSRGFRALGDYLDDHTHSERFTIFADDAASVRDGLDRVRYTLRIKGARVTVGTYEEEDDYSVEVEETFRRFRQGVVDEHQLKIPDPGSMDHVEARIVELVARIYPREFEALDAFCTSHRDFPDERIVRFDREVQFYLAYLEHLARIEKSDLAFCYPEVSAESKETAVEGLFDLALATKLSGERQPVVRNGLALHAPERVLVVSGPNQGGKTTFARAFGQLHHLAGLGLPVPAASARLYLADAIFTHFERAEDMTTLRGKLDDELVRMHEILEQATGDSVVVVNEIFASTTLDDAIFLGTEALRRLIELDCLAVCVTFIDELASLGSATVSMVAAVEPADPSKRTFRIERRPADGRAYAWALAEKYGLSYESARKRLAP